MAVAVCVQRQPVPTPIVGLQHPLPFYDAFYGTPIDCLSSSLFKPRNLFLGLSSSESGIDPFAERPGTVEDRPSDPGDLIRQSDDDFVV